MITPITPLQAKVVIKQSTWLANAAPEPDQQALATSRNMYNPYRVDEDGGTQQVRTPCVCVGGSGGGGGLP